MHFLFVFFFFCGYRIRTILLVHFIRIIEKHIGITYSFISVYVCIVCVFFFLLLLHFSDHEHFLFSLTLSELREQSSLEYNKRYSMQHANEVI